MSWDIDLTTPDGVVALMESSKTEQEWNKNADAVLKANGGKYPSFWFAKIVIAGVGLAKNAGLSITSAPIK